MIIDRYGDNPVAEFFAPEGTPFEARALPYASDARPLLVRYRVLKPVPVQAGETAAWFDQPGGGTQFKTTYDLERLLDEEFLERLP